MEWKEASVLLSGAFIIMYTVLKTKQNRGKQKEKVKRKLWSRKWLLKRNSGKDLKHLVMNELRYEDPASFQNFTRMKAKTFEKLLNKVRPAIEKQNTVLREAISPETRLLLTLRFLATGQTFKSLSFGFRVSESAISKIVHETLPAIYVALKDDYLSMPHTEEQWKNISEEFQKQWNFPNCLGALDGKHIAIRSKKEYGSYYYNYKGFHSIILLALVDANYRFLYVDVGTNGRVNDAAVYNKSSLCSGIRDNKYKFPSDEALPGTNKKVPYVIIADDAFKLTTRMLKPYGRRNNEVQKIFNYRLSRARRVVENAFGILANKFQVLQKEIDLSVEKVEQITLTCCVLHNFIRSEDGINTQLLDRENTNNLTLTQGSWRQSVFLTHLQRAGSNRSGDEAMELRNHYCQYFSTTGFVSWQWEAIKKFNF